MTHSHQARTSEPPNDQPTASAPNTNSLNLEAGRRYLAAVAGIAQRANASTDPREVRAALKILSRPSKALTALAGVLA